MLELALALTLVTAQTSEPRSIARELEQIERQLAATWKKGDCDAWGAMLAPEWSVIHITGNIMTKPEALEMCRAQKSLLESLASDELSVRSFGDAAIVTGRTSATTSGDKRETVTLRFTDVFIRRERRWQVVASHATRIVPE
jgi:ketosteroid isomerase-like protein